MRKKIRFFKQHTMETCGAACMLMILDLYRKTEYPTPKQELKLYSLYRSRAFKGMNGAAIANCLSKNGLDIALLHSSHRMMDNRDGYYSEELYEALLEEYRADAGKCAGRVQLTTGAVITCGTLRQALDAGGQIILQCIVPGNADGIHDHTLHWVVVYGYERNEFLVCDPLSSKIRITAEALESYMDTPIGRICIVVGEKT
ncbi:MAG: peptidase C39 family protein [Oscillospiraceae bacterium]|nr:peptidase C39 family protein [Oscillospiraceae bacterium]